MEEIPVAATVAKNAHLKESQGTSQLERSVSTNSSALYLGMSLPKSTLITITSDVAPDTDKNRLFINLPKDK